MNAQTFAESRDALAAEFRFNAGVDSVTVSARMLTENRSKAADLLRREGARCVVIAATHAILSGPAVERLGACGAEEIIVKPDDKDLDLPLAFLEKRLDWPATGSVPSRNSAGSVRK